MSLKHLRCVGCQCQVVGVILLMFFVAKQLEVVDWYLQVVNIQGDHCKMIVFYLDRTVVVIFFQLSWAWVPFIFIGTFFNLYKWRDLIFLVPCLFFKQRVFLQERHIIWIVLILGGCKYPSLRISWSKLMISYFTTQWWFIKGLELSNPSTVSFIQVQTRIFIQNLCHCPTTIRER